MRSVGLAAVRGMLIGLVLGAACGALGVLKTEYKARPWEQAIMIGITGAFYGLVIGAAWGIVVFRWRKK